MLRLLSETLYELTADQLTQVAGAAGGHESCITMTCITDLHYVKIHVVVTESC